MDTEQNLTSQKMKIDRLMGFLSEDPGNLNLLADAAVAAFNAHEYALCDDLLARHDTISALPAQLANLRGLSAMSQGRFEEAAAEFSALNTQNSDPSLSYNVAYANAMCGSFESAASLDAKCLTAIPSAVTLKMRALHYLGRVDEALQLGAEFCDQPNTPPEVKGAYATILFDLGDRESAKRYASFSPETPDSLTIRGLLALEDGDIAPAFKLLGEANERNPQEARAVLGLGLCLLIDERFHEATSMLDKAAEMFSSHAGSWVATGWAWLFAGDTSKARQRFQRAATVDRGFAEAHGALAIVDELEGMRDEALRHTEIALRLDPTCLSGALAKSIQHENAGQADLATALRNAALNRKLGSGERTIAQSISSMTLKGRVGSRRI